ncbi:MATE family efflux transporter [Aeromonas sp. R6-2]|uniref:MATE family efflux transporter n=1 Tax=unclassified Aeromonas TaxID=257493 RepID=UPI0034A23241
MLTWHGLNKMIKIPRHILIAGSSWIARFISATVQIFCIRYVIEAQGYSGYSVFALLSSLLAWAILFEFGIGNALQNYISERIASRNEYYSYIWYLGRFSFIFALAMLAFVYPFSDNLSSWYLKSAEYLSAEYKSSLFYFTISIFAFGAIGSIVYKIWYAEQKGWLANLVIAISSLLGLCFVYLCTITPEFNSLHFIIIAFFSPQAIISFGFFVFRFYNAKMNLVKNKVSINAKPVFHRAFGFWGFAVIATIVLQADAIVLSQKISASDIALYFIMAKIFGMVGFIYSALLQAIWPVCTELRVKKEWVKLKSLSNTYVAIGFFLVLFSGIAIYTFRSILFDVLSVGIDYDISPWLFVLFTVYFILRVWSDMHAMLLQSINYIRPLWYIVPIQASICICVQWYMADYFGLYGIISGLIISFLCTTCIYLPYAYRKKLKEISYA